jgi:hypothetical protein
MSSLFGWGGVKIGSTEFTTAFGVLSFKREDVRNTTIAGKVLVHSKGWRAVIETELFNCQTGDAAKFQSLASIVSASQAGNTAVVIYPRYTSTDNGSLTNYSCFLDSDFNPEDIAQVDVGQTIKLKWIGEELLNSLPSNISNPELITRTTDDSDNTAVRVTDDGDNTALRAACKG